jgi:hypothetical protein
MARRRLPLPAVRPNHLPRRAERHRPQQANPELTETVAAVLPAPDMGWLTASVSLTSNVAECLRAARSAVDRTPALRRTAALLRPSVWRSSRRPIALARDYPASAPQWGATLSRGRRPSEPPFVGEVACRRGHSSSWRPLLPLPCCFGGAATAPPQRRPALQRVQAEDRSRRSASL